MSELKAFITTIRPVAEVYIDMVRNGNMRICRGKDGDKVRARILVDSGKCRFRETEEFLEGCGSNSVKFPSLCEVICTARMVASGPKVFRPSLAECEAFEEVELRIPLECYAQPFPAFVIEYPEGYWVRNECRVRMSGEERAFQPGFTIINHDAESRMIALTTYGRGANSFIFAGLVGVGDHATIEDNIRSIINGSISDSGMESDDAAVDTRCLRVAMNCCMMLVNRGFKRSPETNAALIERLHAQAEKARKREGDGSRTARNNMLDAKAVPQFYQFSQVVSVRGLVGSSGAMEHTPTGRKLRPHWRTAHWKMQPHGPKNSLRKPRLVPHVMVNGDEFQGDVSQTFYQQK